MLGALGAPHLDMHGDRMPAFAHPESVQEARSGWTAEHAQQPSGKISFCKNKPNE